MVRAWFGDLRAGKLTAGDIDRYIEARLAEDYAPASVNRQTGLLAEALRLAHRRGTLTSVIAVRRLPERNARQGFLERADLDKVVAALPDYLQDLCHLGCGHDRHAFHVNVFPVKRTSDIPVALVDQLEKCVGRRRDRRVVCLQGRLSTGALGQNEKGEHDAGRMTNDE